MSEPALRDVPVASIRVSKTIRSTKDPENGSLANTISRFGLLQPIVVRRKGSSYELICGARRLAAIRSLNEPHVSALVVDAGDYDTHLMRLLENVQRKDMTAGEIVESIEGLKREIPGLTITRAAALLGKSDDWVRSKYRYVQVRENALEAGADPEDLAALDEAHMIRLGTAPLSEVPKLAKAAAKENWSARRVFDEARKARVGTAASYASDQSLAVFEGRFGIVRFDVTTVVLRLRAKRDMDGVIEDLVKLGGTMLADAPPRPLKGKWRRRKTDAG